MTIITDKVEVRNGLDFTFMCSKVPFAVTCSSTLQHGAYNLIDLDLVNKMKIPLQRIKVCRMQYMGENLRSVGFIDQTVQCVHQGRVQGTVHLAARVVRNLFDTFNVDCVASAKTYERLTGAKPPDPPEVPDDVDDDYGTLPSSSSIWQSPITKDWLDDTGKVSKKDGGMLPHKSDMREDDDPGPATPPRPRGDSVSSSLPSSEEDNDHDHECDSNCSVSLPTDVDGDIVDDERLWLETQDEADNFCDTCFYNGNPINVARSHWEGCPTCPSLTPEQKEVIIGKGWKHFARKIKLRRHKREKRKQREREVAQARR